MPQFNIRNLPLLTDRQMAELAEKLGMTKTQLVIMAVDRLYQQEVAQTPPELMAPGTAPDR